MIQCTSEAYRGIWGILSQTLKPCQKEKLEVQKEIVVILSLSGGPVAKTRLTKQGPRFNPWVGELDPMCHK